MFTDEQGKCLYCGGGQQDHTWDHFSGLASCPEALRISFELEPQGVVTDKPLKVSDLLALK